jgi:hypothetical protein
MKRWERLDIVRSMIQGVLSVWQSQLIADPRALLRLFKQKADDLGWTKTHS